MKITLPHYDGDGFIRTFISADMIAPAKLAKQTRILQSNIYKPEPVMLDLLEFDRRARAMRSTLMRAWTKRIFGGRDKPA